MPTLRDLSAAMESAVNAALGDEITYTPSGGSASTFDTWVEFAAVETQTQGSRMTGEQIVIELPMAWLSAPSKDDRATVALRPGKAFAPASWEPATTGADWRIILKQVPA